MTELDVLREIRSSLVFIGIGVWEYFGCSLSDGDANERATS